jgi:hypothetical protein
LSLTSSPVETLRLELDTRSLEGYPQPEGAHGLAWSYLLDNIFADAYAHHLERLVMVLPHAALEPLCQTRAALSVSNVATRGKAQGVGLAALTPDVPASLAGYSRFYSLDYGLLAPSAWRERRHTPDDWQPDAQLFVLTWQVKMWGLAMKLLNQAGRPHLADRATFAMRAAFASPVPTPSFYQLRGWIPAVQADPEANLVTDPATPAKTNPAITLPNKATNPPATKPLAYPTAPTNPTATTSPATTSTAASLTANSRNEEQHD